jgi:hypothetical protein
MLYQKIANELSIRSNARYDALSNILNATKITTINREAQQEFFYRVLDARGKIFSRYDRLILFAIYNGKR